MDSCSTAHDDTSTWSIIEPEFEVERTKSFEGLFTQGSGYLHVRGSLEEHLADEPQNGSDSLNPSHVKWGAYVPGLFCPVPGGGRTMINLPFFIGLTPAVDGEELDMTRCCIKNYHRELHMKNALLVRSFSWKTLQGATLEITFERFVSMEHPHLVVQRLSMVSDRPVVATVRAWTDADVRTKGKDYFEEVTHEVSGSQGMLTRVKTTGEHDVAILSRMKADEEDQWAFASDGKGGCLTRCFELAPEIPLVIEKHSVVTTSFDRQPVDALALLADISNLTFEDLLKEHSAIWDSRWRCANVTIEGDDRSDYALRVSIYHLLRAHVTGDSRVSIGAKCFGGDTYNGTFFWDTDIYVLPFYTYTDPERARSLIDFRIQALPGAVRNAKRLGYKGARYPWQSDDKGDEGCAMWEYSQMQPHINCDIVYAADSFARATGDEAWLRGEAAEMIVEIARFWCDRVDWRSGDDYPSLLGVMGPDEYQIISNNNAYTNRMTSHALRLAASVGREGGATPEECREFREIADKLPVVRRDDGLVLQAEGFDRKAEVSIEELHTNKELPFMWVVPLAKIYRSRLCKQADVLLMMALFPDDFTDKEVQQAWDYYVPVTTHESSLSACIHAIIALRLGMMEEAWAFWKKGSETDVDTTRKVTTGAAEGPHAAGNGGNWMVTVFGFAGLKNAMESEVLSLSPRLPAGWQRLSFPLVWKGIPLSISITAEEVELCNQGSSDCVAVVNGTQVTVAGGSSITCA